MHGDICTNDRDLVIREILIARSRYLALLPIVDHDSLEAWKDASEEYFYLTGKGHPMGRYVR